jgi:hypothetical protein
MGYIASTVGFYIAQARTAHESVEQGILTSGDLCRSAKLSRYAACWGKLNGSTTRTTVEDNRRQWDPMHPNTKTPKRPKLQAFSNKLCSPRRSKTSTDRYGHEYNASNKKCGKEDNDALEVVVFAGELVARVSATRRDTRQAGGSKIEFLFESQRLFTKL